MFCLKGTDCQNSIQSRFAIWRGSVTFNGPSANLQKIVNFRDTAGEVSNARGGGCEVNYTSDRDDWVLAMVASGFGYGFLPKHSISRDRVISRPLVNPEYW